MSTGVLLPNGEQQFFAQNGAPLAGGKVYLYVPGTTTPQTSWVDQAETTPNTNPIILDSLGRCIIWGSGTYRQYVTDSAGNEVWDQLTSDGGLSTVQGEINTINSEISTINGQITTINNALSAEKQWFTQTKGPNSTTYIASVTDSGTLFESGQSGGTLLIQLPNVTSISVGWFCGLLRINYQISAQVNGSQGEQILVPGGRTGTGIATADDVFENLILTWDGGNFIVISASPNTWDVIGSSTSLAIPNSPLLGGNGIALVPVGVGAGLTLSSGILSTSVAKGMLTGTNVTSGAFTIPSAAIKITAVGGGAGGTSSTGGGAGGAVVQYLSNLNVGETLTVTVGGAGAAGSAGGDTTINSGSQSISLILAGGGQTGGVGGTYSAPFPGIGIGGGAGQEANTSSDTAQGGTNGILGALGNGGAVLPGNVGQSGYTGGVLIEWIQ